MSDARILRLYALDPERGHAPWRGAPDRIERVLHVHLGTSEEPQTSLCQALASLAGQRGYRRIDWPGLPFRARQRAVLDAAASHQPTLIFMQLQSPNALAPATVAELRRVSRSPDLVVMCWCGDVGGVNGPFDSPAGRWAFALAAHCDLMLYTSLSQVRAHRARGMHQAAYLQIGYDEDRYFEGPDEGYGSRWDAAFLGQNYPQRVAATLPGHEAALRRATVAALHRELGARFGLFGGGWGRRVPRLAPARSGDVYRASRLAVSISLASSLERYSSDRVLRALACGAAVLMKAFDDWRSFGLSAGEDVLVWDTPEEAVAIARAHLAPARREQLLDIGRRGARLAREHHSWGVRMQELVPLVAAVRGARVEVARPW